MDRRQFLKAGLGLGAVTGSALLPVDILSTAQAADLGFDMTQGSRTLKLYRPETGERLELEYLRNGEWAPDAYTKLCWLLRDIQVNQHVQMDTRLIAIMDWVQRYLAQYGYTEPLHVLSGYRSQKTNAALEGAAKNSQHLYGKALDLRIPGLPAGYLGKLLTWLSQGGVGTYADRGFVHVDTGRLRQWQG